jgi:hypothetical protein
MQDIPIAVMVYLLYFLIEKRSLGYLLVKKDGSLSNWGGHLSVYGISNLQQGRGIEEQVFFLEGLLPIDDFPVFLPRMKTEEGICADVHIFSSQEGDWVLFLDATLDEMQLSSFQQDANGFCLLEEKLTRILNE